jgi:hypothetical protein
MKLAQMVLTRTLTGRWKIATMTLKETRSVVHFDDPEHAAAFLMLKMSREEWEQLSND